MCFWVRSRPLRILYYWLVHLWRSLPSYCGVASRYSQRMLLIIDSFPARLYRMLWIRHNYIAIAIAKVHHWCTMTIALRTLAILTIAVLNSYTVVSNALLISIYLSLYNKQTRLNIRFRILNAY